MMPDRWRITFHGGFAWVFEGDDTVGHATGVTVGAYRTQSGHPRYHPHEMVLRVPADALNLQRTTLPYVTLVNNHIFVLRGPVTLNADASGDIERRISATQPEIWNDFYWVYDADRFRDRTGKLRTPLGNWRERLVAQLDLRNGVLEVLAPRVCGIYDISDGRTTIPQPLATHIVYHPRWTRPEVEFTTPDGVVVARPAAFDIAAECGCSDEPPVGEVAGFDVTFGLYRDPGSAPRFIPSFRGFTPPPPALEPGPDCPPRAYSI